MVRAIFVLLLLIFLARAIWKLLEGILRGAVDGSQASASQAKQPTAVKMVQDPVCGTFVVPGRSPSLVQAGETKYFCSDTCRSTFAAHPTS